MKTINYKNYLIRVDKEDVLMCGINGYYATIMDDNHVYGTEIGATEESIIKEANYAIDNGLYKDEKEEI